MNIEKAAEAALIEIIAKAGHEEDFHENKYLNSEQNSAERDRNSHVWKTVMAPAIAKAIRAAAPHLQEGPSVILSDGEDGWTIAEFPSMPGCISQGKGESEALRNLADAIEAVREVKQKMQPQPVDGDVLDSLTAEEIKEVEHIFGDCCKQQIDYVFSARRARLTAKKTPEERVKVEFISASDDFGHTVFMDAEESGYFKTRGNAEIYRLGLIAKLRESEGK